MSIDVPSSPYESLSRVASSAAALVEQVDGKPVPEHDAARVREKADVIRVVIEINHASARALAWLRQNPIDYPLFAPIISRLRATYEALQRRFHELAGPG